MRLSFKNLRPLDLLATEAYPIYFPPTIQGAHLSYMKPNIDNKGRVARGGMAVVFLLFGACLIPEAPVFAAIFSLIGLFCAFEAWIGWCAVRACGVKTPL
jgi:Protein of unknown function (DUF2892)